MGSLKVGSTVVQSGFHWVVCLGDQRVGLWVVQLVAWSAAKTADYLVDLKVDLLVAQWAARSAVKTADC